MNPDGTPRRSDLVLPMYGFLFTEGDVSGSAPDDWPVVRVRHREDVVIPDQHTAVIGPDVAQLDTREVCVRVERDPATVEFAGSRLLGFEELRHPYLAFPAAALSHWAGWSALHGGAFLGADGAIVVLGEKEAGKSTFLAAANAAGHPVLSDDLVVLREMRALAGPRCVDLRADVAAELGGRPLGVVGSRSRWRVELPSCPQDAPVVAFVRLHTGHAVDVEKTDVATASSALFASFALGLGPGSAEDPFDLLDVPMFDVTRPWDLRLLPTIVERVVQASASAM